MKKLIKTILFWAFAFWCVEAAEAEEYRDIYDYGYRALLPHTTAYFGLVDDIGRAEGLEATYIYFNAGLSYVNLGLFPNGGGLKDGVLLQYEDDPVPIEEVKFWNDAIGYTCYSYRSDGFPHYFDEKRPKATLVISVPRDERWQFSNLLSINCYNITAKKLRPWEGIDLKKNTKWYYNDRFYEDTHSFLKDYYKDTNGKLPTVLLEALCHNRSTRDYAKTNKELRKMLEDLNNLGIVGLDERVDLALETAIHEFYSEEEIESQAYTFARLYGRFAYLPALESVLEMYSFYEDGKVGGGFYLDENGFPKFIEFREDGWPVNKEFWKESPKYSWPED